MYCGQFLSAIEETMEDMANTSSRSFRLLSLLQNHRYWSGADLAERLGVSARTLRRDVDRLRELGYPVQAHPGVTAAISWPLARRCRRSSSTMRRPSRSRSACC